METKDLKEFVQSLPVNDSWASQIKYDYENVDRIDRQMMKDIKIVREIKRRNPNKKFKYDEMMKEIETFKTEKKEELKGMSYAMVLLAVLALIGVFALNLA